MQQALKNIKESLSPSQSFDANNNDGLYKLFPVKTAQSESISRGQNANSFGLLSCVPPELLTRASKPSSEVVATSLVMEASQLEFERERQRRRLLNADDLASAFSNKCTWWKAETPVGSPESGATFLSAASSPTSKSSGSYPNSPAQPSWITPRSPGPQYASPNSSPQNDKRGCRYCMTNSRNLQMRNEAMRHVCKDELGRVVCPILSQHECEYCGATGENAHTRTHCPFSCSAVKTQKELSRTRRNSTGIRKPAWMK